ncbi:hypothetical protein WICPIJ_005832 [Wickerhamomyces pijperi]|uniref:Uncharacterized protein n=1 Tax=Wickerhamomyces pijperi TaxID=599730 RepID=A0A9P8Q4Y8_WICPI|nr:hypothetical protein WICPIJ_005832 [Wickerhamomyces pijperi]
MSQAPATTTEIAATGITPEQVEENLRLIEDLKFFLATAPANWQKNQIIRRYYLNHDEGFVSCVYWNNLYFITGTDIVRCIVYRFEHFGRIIVDRKKFEEGIFSDLRGLKCGTDAVLEPSKSPFLDFLHKSSCLRTQKKQKVFFWFSVPHDKLFTDALERDLKKEGQGLEGTTRSKYEPSLSFNYDSTKNLSEQLLEFVKRDTPVEEFSDVNNQDDNSTIPINTPSDTNFDSQFNTPNEAGISPQVVTFNEDGKGSLQESEITHTVLRDDDDFPLDFFPAQLTGFPPFATAPIQQPQMDATGRILIDPSIFLNPPESYNEQSLLDQTYAKTPFFQTEFDNSAKSDRAPAGAEGETPTAGDADTGEDYQDLFDPPATAMNSFLPPQFYPQQPQFYPMPMVNRMSNAQFYDSQLTGGQSNIDMDSFLPPQPTGYPGMMMMMPQQPYYYHQPVPHQFMYDPYQQFDPQMMPGFGTDQFEGMGNVTNDDDAFLYENQNPMSSPFGRFFPSFQATAPPPQSPRNSRVVNTSNGGRFKVGKPGSSNLKHSTSNKTTTSSNKGATFIMKQVQRSVIDSQEELDQSGKTDESTGAADKEYNSLPTPESTVPENQRQSRNTNAEMTSTADAGTEGDQLGDELSSFLEEAGDHVEQENK